jgi:RimJ/RimL family protein N-acetyltransferase
MTHRPVEYKRSTSGGAQIYFPSTTSRSSENRKMSNSDPSWEPKGALVSPIPAMPPSVERTLSGSHVTLIPLRESHTEELYRSIGGVQNAQLYKYLLGGPFVDFESFAGFIKSLCERTFCFPYAILVRSPTGHETPSSSEEHAGTLEGIICFMNVMPSNRSIEIGLVAFGSLLQRTTAATEACYLMMKHGFEDLHYVRVEWKANNFNEPSKRAALRLGFLFEGLFRKHMVVKGRSRDTAWFSVIDEEWEGGVREALESWLRSDNFDEQRRQKTKLEDIRKGILVGKK